MLRCHNEKNVGVRQSPFLELDDADVAYDHTQLLTVTFVFAFEGLGLLADEI